MAEEPEDQASVGVIDEDNSAPDLEDRKKDYSGREKIKEQLAKIYQAVDKGFEDKKDQNDVIERCWDVYNCVLGDNQAYVGNSRIFVPLVRDAVEARVTRFCNQLFPQTGRYSDVVGSEGETPYETIALLDHYVDRTRLRDVVAPALVRSGDVTGQYILYVDWVERTRYVTKKVKKPHDTHIAANGESPEGAPEYDDMESEKIKDGLPDVMVLDARNVVVLPASVDEIEDAEIIAVRLWWTEEKLKRLAKEGVLEQDAVNELIDNIGSSDARPNDVDTQKKATSSASVKMDSKGGKRVQIYQIWSKLKLAKGEYRWCVAHAASPDLFLGCKRNPFWSDRVPVIGAAAQKVDGSWWGKPRVSAVEKIQIQANDAVNMGMDSAQYSLMPIVMTDPEKNPRLGSLVVAMAALWETSPNDTKFVEFPQLWKEAMEIVAACKDQIMQSLSVNPAMMPHAGAGKKPSQAEAAQAQQVALESTADVTSILETGILSRLLQWFYELDYQYRDQDITIREYGEMGLQANMQQVPPIQVGAHYTFRWYGSEASKTVQQVQQMIAAMNVVRGIPPQQLNGRKIDIGPIVEQLALAAFGPRIAPKVLIDQRHQISMDPMQENQLMVEGFPTHVNASDDDVAHIKIHMLVLNMDTHAMVRQHIMEHQLQMQAKMKEASGQGQPGSGGAPGVPGGASPGVPGTPRIGAQPGQPRPVQNPPGVISTDHMPTAMPRKAG